MRVGGFGLLKVRKKIQTKIRELFKFSTSRAFHVIRPVFSRIFYPIVEGKNPPSLDRVADLERLTKGLTTSTTKR